MPQAGIERAFGPPELARIYDALHWRKPHQTAIEPLLSRQVRQLRFGSGLRGRRVACDWNRRGLGCFRSSSGGLLRCGLGLFGWSNDRVERGAFHARHELDEASFADVQDQPVDNLVAKVAVSHLAALEAQ